MSTTTKRKRDEAENEGPPNKKIKGIGQSPSLPLQLIPELWLQIFLCISYKQIGPIRLVCTQWNKMTLSKDYSKALCIKKFGHNIGPLKITDLASLTKVPDSDLVLIPTIQEGSRLVVDWFAYYDIRMLLWFTIREIMEYSDEELPENADLTYSIIEKIVEMTDSDAIGYYKFCLLLKLIPLLIQHERNLLASRILSLMLAADGETYSLPKLIDHWLDVHDITLSHFSDQSTDVFKMACNAADDFCTFHKNEARIHIFGERVFPRLLRKIILLASKELEGHEGDIKRIIQARDLHRDNFPIIITRGRLNTVYSKIVPICQKEFELADDWRMKESALLATFVSSCINETYSHDCIKFAIKVLSDKQHHKQVLQAAAIVMCSHLVHKGGTLSQDEFDQAFEGLIFASQQVEAKHVLNIINHLILLLDMQKDNVSEDKLDQFHTTLFKVLMIPGVISESIVEVTNTLGGSIYELAVAFGQRLHKYLPQYHECFFKLASHDANFIGTMTPADIVAYYLDIGPLIEKNFHHEACDIVKQVQDGTIGFEVNVEQFHALCPIESLSTPNTDPKALIESILKLYPSNIIKPLHHDCTTVNNNGNVVLPDYIPHFKHQYDKAVEKMHQIDSSEWPNLFNFSLTPGPTSSISNAFSQPMPEIFSDDIQLILAGNMTALQGLSALIDISKQLLSSGDPKKKDLLIEFAPSILSLIINCMQMSSISIWEEWISGAKFLLQHISENFPSHVSAFYLTAFLGAWNGAAIAEYQEIKELYDSIHHIILTKYDDPPIHLLSQYFEMLFCAKARGAIHWIARLKALEEIILHWPRTAWMAFLHGDVATELLAGKYQPRAFKTNLVGRKLAWRLLMKYYGYKRITTQVPCLKNAPAGYFYDGVLTCMKYLDELDSDNKELIDIAKEILPKFAIFCRLYQVDKNAGDVCFFNQYITDQSNIGQILKITNPELVIEELKGNYFSLFF